MSFSRPLLHMRLTGLLLAANLLLFSALAGLAQVEENRLLDGVKTSLDQAEAELAKPIVDDAVLLDLSRRVDQARSSISEVQQGLTPRQQAITTRIEQLGEKPGEGAAPESAEIAQERETQLAARQPIDETLKRTGLLLVQSDQIVEQISAKRRDLFNSRVLGRTRSLLAPSLWADVVDEVPRRWTAASGFLTQWGNLFTSRLDLQSGAVLGIAILLAIALMWPIRIWSQRLGRRYVFEQVASGGRLKRAAAALWVVLITSAAPVAAAFVLYQGLTIPDLVPDRAIPFLQRLVALTAFVSVIAGLNQAVLAPGRPSWRLAYVSDEAAQRIAAYPLWIASIYALTRVVQGFLDIIGIGLAPTVALDGVTAVLIALIFALGLQPAKETAEETEGQPSAQAAQQAQPDGGWMKGAARLIAWIAIAVVMISVATGYISFGFFLIQQMIWISVLGAALYILLALVDGLCAAGAHSPVGRFARGTLGLRDQRFGQICAVVSGFLHLVLIVLAVMLAAAPWGIQGDDAVSWFDRALAGFQLGGLSVSPLTILGAIAFLTGGILLTRAVQRWLDKTYLPLTRMDEGLKNSIGTATGYAGTIIAVGLAVSSLGFGLEKFAIVAGALSVGIGFGLQAIVSNFVSGLILLAERPIKVGDWVGIGGEEGNVRRISVRSTVVEKFDRSMMIVPNSDLITKPVLNRTHQNPLGRVNLKLGTSHAASVQEVRDLLKAAAQAHKSVLANPAPVIEIVGTTDVGVQWQMFCYVPSPRQTATTRSDLYLDILTQLQAKGMNITASP
ncbi:DUF3772 domain-containing protein [Terrihabitans sp. B22-R8]|uniref:DUF3772 domain-containing protein n=1 Tax=Terrihabitans sp. B22-R8 TaxID=3425128 RepID=UPI00403CD5EA